MRNIIKTFILIVAFIAAVIGVMSFFKTKISPPEKLSMIDVYRQHYDDKVENFLKLKNDKAEDKAYTQLREDVTVFLSESKMERGEVNSCLGYASMLYASRFTTRSFAKFAQPVWKEDEHDYMLTKAETLGKLPYGNENSKSVKDSLRTITKVIGDYRDATRLSHHRTFDNIQTERTILPKVQSYKKDKYLSNCKALVDNLSKVRPAISRSHFKYVTDQVDLLKESKYFTKEFVKGTLIPNARVALREYDDNANELYGPDKKDTGPLWAILSQTSSMISNNSSR